jgi:hypothetical protein
MSALLAIVIMIGLILPIPIGAGFADWMNEVNAPTLIDDKYVAFTNDTATQLYEWDLNDGTGYKAYFYWSNHTGDEMKHNVTNAANDGILEADLHAVDSAWHYDYVLNTGQNADDMVDWEKQVPYWLVTFDYSAKQAYADNIVQFHLMMDHLVGVENDAEETGVTVQLTAGGVTIYTTTIAYDEADDEIDTNITLTPEILRAAIIGGGATSYFQLKVVGHGANTFAQSNGTAELTLDISGTQLYTYNVAKLFGRDDGLYLAAMISTILAALGIFLVTPKYNLPWKGRGF